MEPATRSGGAHIYDGFMEASLKIQISTQGLPDKERFEFWHDEVCKSLLHITPVPPSDDLPFSASIDVQITSRFQVARFDVSHGSVVKTASDLSRDPHDNVLLYIAIGKPQLYTFGGQDYLLNDGDTCIVPIDRRYQGGGNALNSLSFLMPRSVLSPLLAGGNMPGVVHLPSAAPLAMLLRASLDATVTQLPGLSDALGDAVLHNLSGLVALAHNVTDEGRESGRHAVQAARLVLLKRYIDRNLTEPGLDPASAAAALGISVRQVHLLFLPSPQSFAQYLLRQRLEACMATLSNPLGTRRSVADIAFGWGFSSLSVFYRAFADAFGQSPGDVRDATLTTVRSGGFFPPTAG